MLLAGAVAVLALPSAVLAFSTGIEPAPLSELSGHVPQMAADARAGLSPALSLRSLAKGPLFPFTPAGTPNRPHRSVTVAVRVDPATARDILVRAPQLARTEEAKAVPVRIAPTGFTLGVSRGYRNFAQNLVPHDGNRDTENDMDAFTVAPGPASAPARLAPRIVLDDSRPSGRAPRTFAGDGENKVDLGGTYRLTRNLNVTAGVRYSQERERLRPLTDGNPDNQAVYVGTQFRF